MERIEGTRYGFLHERIDRCKEVALELLLNGGPGAKFGEDLDTLCRAFPPSRTPLLQTLAPNLRFPGIIAPSLLIHGTSGSGKSFFVEKLLTSASQFSPWVKIDCHRVRSPADMYCDALEGMTTGIIQALRNVVAESALRIAAEGRMPRSVAEALAKPDGGLAEADLFAGIVAACLEPSDRLMYGSYYDDHRIRLGAVDVASAAKQENYDQQRLFFLEAFLNWMAPAFVSRELASVLLRDFSLNKRYSPSVRQHVRDLSAQLHRDAAASSAGSSPGCPTMPAFVAEVIKLASLTFEMLADAATFIVCGYLAVPADSAFKPRPTKTTAQIAALATDKSANANAYLAQLERPLRLNTLNFRFFMDDIERLYRFDGGGSGGTLIASFFTLHTAAKRSITVLATSCAGAFVRSTIALLPQQPYSIPFLCCNAEETASILASLPIPSDAVQDRDLFKAFTALINRNFGPMLGYNLHDLKSAIEFAFPAYTMPIRRGEFPPSATSRELFMRFSGFFDSMKATLREKDGFPQLRPLTEAEKRKSSALASEKGGKSSNAAAVRANSLPAPEAASASDSAATGFEMDVDAAPSSKDTGKAAKSTVASAEPEPLSITAQVPVPAAEMRVPRTARFMLLASFLASINPESTDRTYFSVQQTGKNRALGQAALDRLSRAKERRMLHGPQPASYERIYAIFNSLLSSCAVDEYEVDRVTRLFMLPEEDVQLQFSTLAALGLVERSAAAHDTARFTCTLGWESALRVAKSLGVELGRFIYDPG